MALLAGGSEAFLANADRLLAHRRAQRGRPTLGDEHDARFLAHLATLHAPAPDALTTFGESMGRHVYAKQHTEDSLTHALAVLSRALEGSGVGALDLDGAFHREAHVVLRPKDEAARCAHDVLAAYASGLLKGFLSESLNCEANAETIGDLTFRVKLGAGRDVNRRASP